MDELIVPGSSICRRPLRRKRRSFSQTSGSATRSRRCSIRKPPCALSRLPARMREKSVTSTSFSAWYSMLPNSARNSGLFSTITGAPLKPSLSTTRFTR
jgi:hypothetical protein